MRNHAVLAPFFWTRGSGKRLRGNADAQVVAVYLSTAPGANMIGIYHLSIATIASDTGLPEKRVRAALASVAEAGYAAYDEDAELAWVPNHAKFDVGEILSPGDKKRPKLYIELAQVKGHPFEVDFRRRYALAYGLQPPTEGACIDAELPPDGACTFRLRSGPVPSLPDHSQITAPQDAPAAPTTRRGTRLPDGWAPSAETQEWSKAQGVTDPMGAILDDFRDYWLAIPGAKGVKLNWDATFRNRVRQVAQRSPTSRTLPRQQLGAAAGAKWMRPEQFDFETGGGK